MKRQYKRNSERKLDALGMRLSAECPHCGEKQFHYDKYDSDCCIGCDIWFDERCGDPECPYCSVRPETPSEALFSDENKNSRAKD